MYTEDFKFDRHIVEQHTFVGQNMINIMFLCDMGTYVLQRVWVQLWGNTHLSTRMWPILCCSVPIYIWNKIYMCIYTSSQMYEDWICIRLWINKWHLISVFMLPLVEIWDCVLTHWGRDKMDAILQTTLSNAFSWMKMLEFRLKFHWHLFLRVQFTIFQHWFR